MLCGRHARQPLMACRADGGSTVWKKRVIPAVRRQHRGLRTRAGGAPETKTSTSHGDSSPAISRAVTLPDGRTAAPTPAESPCSWPPARGSGRFAPRSARTYDDTRSSSAPAIGFGVGVAERAQQDLARLGVEVVVHRVTVRGRCGGRLHVDEPAQQRFAEERRVGGAFKPRFLNQPRDRQRERRGGEIDRKAVGIRATRRAAPRPSWRSPSIAAPAPTRCAATETSARDGLSPSASAPTPASPPASSGTAGTLTGLASSPSTPIAHHGRKTRSCDVSAPGVRARQVPGAAERRTLPSPDRQQVQQDHRRASGPRIQHARIAAVRPAQGCPVRGEKHQAPHAWRRERRRAHHRAGRRFEHRLFCTAGRWHPQAPRADVAKRTRSRST